MIDPVLSALPVRGAQVARSMPSVVPSEASGTLFPQSVSNGVPSLYQVLGLERSQAGPGFLRGGRN